MIDDNEYGEILQDKKNGKERPWKRKKVKSMMLADSFQRLRDYNKANRVKECATYLEFIKELDTGEKRLRSANFCRVRLCPMCQWRRSIKVFCEVSRVMDVVQERYENYVPVFLTLTVKNCRVEELSSTIDGIIKNWADFTEQRKMRKVIKGWYRAIEVTYDKEEYITKRRYNRNKERYDEKGIGVGDRNPNYDTFHPHIHVILLVEKGYFTGKDYMKIEKWVRYWRTAVKADYDPICDIRKVKTSGGKYKAVAEVAKYTLKDSDFLVSDKQELMDRLVNALSKALRSRRLYAFGGVMKKIARELGAEKPEEGDLVNTGEERIRKDVATVMETYRWTLGVVNYLRDVTYLGEAL